MSVCQVNGPAISWQSKKFNKNSTKRVPTNLLLIVVKISMNYFFFLQGTKELREAFKNPEAVPALCNVLVSSPNPQIRQYAVVLLRKRFTKARYWSRIPVENRNRFA